MSSCSTSKKILVILTNTPHLKGHGGGEGGEKETRTGFDIKEVGYLWMTFKKMHNLEIVFATPKGGEAPIDPRSMEDAQADSHLKEFLQNRSFLDCFKNTKSLRDILREEEPLVATGDKPGKSNYRWVIVPGCRGTLFDLPEDRNVIKVIECILKSNGCVATIGHGLSALINVRNVKGSTHFDSSSAPQTEEYFLKGKRVTGFTREEEKKMKYEDLLPFILEDKVKERGAKFEKTEPFGVKVVEDEHILTAQNRNSTMDWIKKIMEKIQRTE